MGEPLLNYERVMRAAEVLSEPCGGRAWQTRSATHNEPPGQRLSDEDAAVGGDQRGGQAQAPPGVGLLVVLERGADRGPVGEHGELPVRPGVPKARGPVEGSRGEQQTVGA